MSVLLYHYTFKYNVYFPDNPFAAPFVFGFGNFGIQLFFIISGFVIFLSVQSIDSVARFAYKRLCRLFPTYWLCLCLTFCVTSLYPAEQLQRSWPTFIANFTMIHRLLGFESVDGVYWSLIPELAFYFHIGWLLFTNRIGRIRWISVAWLALVYVNIYVSLPRLVEWPLILNYGMYFIAGIHFYLVFRGRAGPFVHVVISLCLLASVLSHDSIADYLLVSLTFALFYAFVLGKVSYLGARPLLFLGKISYPLYLTHQYIGYVVIDAALNRGIENPYVLMCLPALVSILGSSLIVVFYERPVLGLLRRSSGRRAPSSRAGHT